jgi:xylan 1,4-beta-xylosidase
MRIFGKAAGELPETPRNLRVRRDADKRNAFLNWEDVPGAVGYNIRWGIQANKLYQTYQVFADQRPQLEIRALTIGQKYSFAIETFNETGVSPLSEAVTIE